MTTPVRPADEAQQSGASSEAVTLGDLVTVAVDAVRNHARPALYAAGAVCLLTAGYLVLAPRKYRSEAQLYVRMGRESVTLDPTATTGETVAVNATREHEINSVVEILSARGNYRAVVDRMSPEVVLEKTPPDAATGHPDAMHFVSFSPASEPTSAEQLAVSALEKQIVVESVRRSNIIDASCVAGSPELAQRLLDVYLNAAIERHMRASRAAGSFEFFQDQARDISTQYENASVELAKLKSQLGVASLEERRKTLQQQLSTIESQASTSQASLAETSGTIRELQRRISEISQTTVATTVGQPQDALGESERQRNLLEIREQQLLAKFTARHPAVIEVREQIDQAELMLAGAAGRKQSVQALNPTYTQVETKLYASRASAEGLRDKLETLELERQRVNARLAELNQSEAQIAGLEERVTVLRKAGADYTKKLEQARIDRALELERLSNITISQPATFEPKAVSPKRRIAAVAGLVLAIIMGFVVALYREWTDRGRALFDKAGVSV